MKCDYVGKTNQLLELHVSHKHTAVWDHYMRSIDKPYECDVCNWRYGSLQQLKKHKIKYAKICGSFPQVNIYTIYIRPPPTDFVHPSGRPPVHDLGQCTRPPSKSVHEVDGPDVRGGLIHITKAEFTIHCLSDVMQCCRTGFFGVLRGGVPKNFPCAGVFPGARMKKYFRHYRKNIYQKSHVKCYLLNLIRR